MKINYVAFSLISNSRLLGGSAILLHETRQKSLLFARSDNTPYFASVCTDWFFAYRITLRARDDPAATARTHV